MKGKKLAVGAALATLPVLGLTSPAAADASGQQERGHDVTFTLQGTPHFCNVQGFSSYVWDEETDRTSVSGFTQFRGEAGTDSTNDARCRQAAVDTRVTIHWLDGDNKIHGSEGYGSGTSYVETDGFGPGNVNEVNGNHVARYFCDSGGQITICTHSVATSPSTK